VNSEGGPVVSVADAVDALWGRGGGRGLGARGGRVDAAVRGLGIEEEGEVWDVFFLLRGQCGW
jgi:hypothetical protein